MKCEEDEKCGRGINDEAIKHLTKRFNILEKLSDRPIAYLDFARHSLVLQAAERAFLLQRTPQVISLCSSFACNCIGSCHSRLGFAPRVTLHCRSCLWPQHISGIDRGGRLACHCERRFSVRARLACECFEERA